ncbi:uncharacterized protein LOC128838569 [Malaclemys terrapin pileata]|uniref:uncharacterized protein LOC128838569 n=1 Tax=Malaclemys terrapin pileata TaxID=2991368 RepID=UPI0023A8318F|nr:uncharacterized protein LOC128838569 [Malaclemys terrapin pileata]
MYKQGLQLQDMLNQLSHLAGESHPPQSHTLRALNQPGFPVTSDVCTPEFRAEFPGQGEKLRNRLKRMVEPGLSNFERTYRKKLPDKIPPADDVATPCPHCGLWGCAIGCTGRDNVSTHRPLDGANPFAPKPPAYSSDVSTLRHASDNIPGGSGPPDPVRRWHGLIREAHIEGEFAPEAYPVVTPDPQDPAAPDLHLLFVTA